MSQALSFTNLDQLAGSYTRISKARGAPDDPETTAGVRRQAEQNLQLARSKGWTVDETPGVGTTYVDNDVTASGKKKRPEFERLLADLEAGRFRYLVVWHLDRLLRVRGDLDRLITICDRNQVQIVSVQAGEVDLRTASGRMMLTIVTAVSTFELEHLRERLRLKHEQLATEGAPNGGPRPFGYEKDRVTLRAPYTVTRADGTTFSVDEPALIRMLAERIGAGASLRGLADELNQIGIPCVRPTAKWSHGRLRTIFIAARISGRREVFGETPEGKHVKLGRIVGNGQWPAIISAELSDDLRQFLSDPKRRARVGVSSSRHLLAGLLYCASCRARLYSWGRGSMGCSGCRKTKINSQNLTHLITTMAIKKVNEGALEIALRSDDHDVAAEELAKVQDRQRFLAAEWAAEAITNEEWVAAKEVLAARQATLQNALDRNRRAHGLANLPKPLAGSWDSLDVEQQRTLLRWLITRIEVGPAIRRGAHFEPERIEVTWRQM